MRGSGFDDLILAASTGNFHWKLPGSLPGHLPARHRRLPRSRWFYRALAAAGPASLVALIAGWMTTEVGRQPWIVYRVMRTEDAVTGASGIPVGYATLALVYLGLLGAVAWVLGRLARAPLDLAPDATR